MNPIVFSGWPLTDCLRETTILRYFALSFTILIQLHGTTPVATAKEALKSALKRQSATSPSPAMISRLGCLQQLSEINDHLYLSGAAPIRPDRIRQRKISCIINVTVDEPSLYLPGIDYLKIRVDDSPFAHLDSYFDLVADRIRQTKDRGGKTLLHCVAGVSRSASLALVYLMKYERMSLRQAYYHVKSIRPIVRPNPGFWRQLIDYERRLLGRNTVKMVLSKFNDMVPDVYTEEVKNQPAWVPTILKSPASQHSRVSGSKPSRTGFFSSLYHSELLFPKF